jgi:hypothetical protein
MAAVNTGTTCLFGISPDQVDHMFVQSYSVSATFNLSATVVDENGVTTTARYDDRKTELTVEGICKTSGMPEMGDPIEFTVNADTAYPGGTKSTSYVGTITAVSQKGSNKDFTSVTVTAVCFEGVDPVGA